MPSKFEPCGLTQMEAMAKGALPVARATGGLVNTIRDGVDGFVSYTYAETLAKALETFYDDKDTIEKMRAAAMNKDFSWNAPNGALDKYHNLFHTGSPS